MRFQPQKSLHYFCDSCLRAYETGVRKSWGLEHECESSVVWMLKMSESSTSPTFTQLPCSLGFSSEKWGVVISVVPSDDTLELPGKLLKPEMADSSPRDSDWICLGWGLESLCFFKFPRWYWYIVRLRTTTISKSHQPKICLDREVLCFGGMRTEENRYFYCGFALYSFPCTY